LELGWFDWRAKTLALTQHKTGLPLTLSLPGDVGWAVIDYIRLAGLRRAVGRCS